MRGASYEPTSDARTRGGRSGLGPTLQIICLASGGGPAEDNVTGFLVRSITTRWSKQSVLAVDAGSHLASITRLLSDDFPLASEPPSSEYNARLNGADGAPPHTSSSAPGSESSFSSRSSSPEQEDRTLTSGPFADLAFPFQTARANALHVVREYVSTYLITHPHLDHIAAFAMNTAAFHATSRPKRLAALPSTVKAIKTHIFNDIIWPNLTDEDGGVGFVTFQRLTEGGNPAVGEGRGKGYIEVCDGLCVKGFKVSHGHCMHGPTNALRTQGAEAGLSEVPAHRPTDKNHRTSFATGTTSNINEPLSPTATTTNRSDRTPSLTKLSSVSISSGSSAPPPVLPSASSNSTATDQQQQPPPPPNPLQNALVVDSTAYFIRASSTPHHELLIFGDVEPDTLSLHPRNAAVWAEAAPKIASGHLKAVVIECSYDDSQADAILFGHLCPRHLLRELCVLAGMVQIRMAERRKSRKRKRNSSHFYAGGGLPPSLTAGRSTHGTTTADTTRAPSLDPEPELYRSGRAMSTQPSDGGEEVDTPSKRLSRHSTSGATAAVASTTTDSMDFESPVPIPGDLAAASTFPITASTTTSTTIPLLDDTAPPLPPLSGLTILVMHVKDSMKDGPLVGDTILRQLREGEARLKEADGVGLGCAFEVSRTGASYYF